jgi:hypothetical protein
MILNPPFAKPSIRHEGMRITNPWGKPFTAFGGFS